MTTEIKGMIMGINMEERDKVMDMSIREKNTERIESKERTTALCSTLYSHVLAASTSKPKYIFNSFSI
jgi:hypothetical protein